MKALKIVTIVVLFVGIPCAVMANPLRFLFTQQMLAKASPDECYDGIGASAPLPIPPEGCAPAVPKVNEAYVWGLTKSGNTIWFGTAPNVHCLVLGTFLGTTSPHENSSWVCEFGQSWYARNTPIPSSIGDWRQPNMYAFDMEANALVLMTPVADPRVRTTTGIRSAGSIDDVIFLGGPNVAGGINLFAFHSDGSYIGSKSFAEFNNIRKWLEVKGQLYTAVGATGGGGYVLKWTGDLSDPPDSVWSFEKVGALDGSGAELSVYGPDRIAVSTWPGPGLAGIFISPVVPEAGGLPGSDSPPMWSKVWQSSDYEPDPVVAYTYGGGALAYYKGFLYWGTMHVPLLSNLAACQFYNLDCDGDSDIASETVLATYRAISIFRGRNLEAVQPGQRQMEVLYGESVLSAFDVPGNTWVETDTGMGPPRYGASGFGNPFNNYTWTMRVVAGQLFVGTMDWSYLFDKMIEDVDLFAAFPWFLRAMMQDHGADLYRFVSSYYQALPFSTDGLGNHLNYGIRTMINYGDNALILGTANPMNLEPNGGWELIKLQNYAGLIW